MTNDKKFIIALVGLFAILVLAVKAHAQIIPAQNQVTISPFGGLVTSTSTVGTRKLEQLIGNTYGQLTYWNGTKWDLIATSSLGLITSVPSDFSFENNFGIIYAASTSPFWFHNDIAASSTVHFGDALKTFLWSSIQGNAGIGTSSPFATLSVQGENGISSSAQASTTLAVKGGKGYPDNQDFVFAGTGGSNTIEGGTGGDNPAMFGIGGAGGDLNIVEGRGGSGSLSPGLPGVVKIIEPSSGNATVISTEVAGDLLINPASGSTTMGSLQTTPIHTLDLWYQNASTSGPEGGLGINNNAGVTGNYAGVIFNTGGAFPGKQYIGGVKNGSNGVGDIVFLNHAAADSNSVFSSDERMRIKSNGNVGIATTSPFGLLSVNPNNIGTVPSFVIGSTTRTFFVVDNRGFVGIATTSPFAPLSVVGAGGVVASIFTSTSTSLINKMPLLLSTNSTSTNATSTGSQYFSFLTPAAGAFLAVDPTGKVISTTTPSSSASGSNWSFLNVSTIQPSTTVGVLVNSSTTLQNFTYVNATGTNATTTGVTFAQKFFDTSGTTGGYKIDNVLILQASSTRVTTFVGNGAGVANTTGSSNTAMGNLALNSNAAGLSNAAFGNSAMRFNNGGSSNTAIGYLAYSSAGSGSSNTGLGAQALNGAVMTGSNNTAAGANAGSSISSGTGNVLFGLNAGDNITSGSGNVILGSNIDAPITTASNQLSIGNLIFGTGLDGTGTTISSGNIGIATTTPWALLSINPNGIGTAPPFSIGSSTRNLFRVESDGDIVTGAPKAPTLGTCGTATITATSTDMRGTISVTAGTPTSCQLVYSSVKSDTPTCVASGNTAALTGGITSASTTGVLFSLAAVFSGNIYYICLQ